MRWRRSILGAALLLGGVVRAQGSCVYYMPYQSYQTFSLQSCCSSGAEFYDNGGPFNFYSPNSRDTLTFTVSSGQIEVVFSEFGLFSGDTLFVYDGSSPSASLLTFLTTSGYSVYSDFAIRSTGTAITFVMKATSLFPSVGWKARVRCISSGSPACQHNFAPGLTTINLASCCSGLRIHDEGGPGVPYYSGLFNAVKRDTLVLVAPSNHRIMLSFGPSFEILSSDTLWLIEGRPTGQVVWSYTNTTTAPPIYHSIKDTVTLIFRARGSGTPGTVPRGQGWIALARCIPKNNCEEYMPSIIGGINRSGFNNSDACCVGGFTIYDHGGPIYPHRRGLSRPGFLATHVVMTGGSGQTYEILLDSMDIQANDTLNINGTLFTGRGSGPVSFTITGSILAHFISDVPTPAPNRGWKATIRCASADNCNYSLSSSSPTVFNLATQGCCAGVRFSDDGGPRNNYSDNRSYSVNFVAPAGRVLKATFAPSFRLEPGDTLYAHDGTSSSDPRLGAFSGNAPPPILISTTNNMYFRFTSNASGNSWGWLGRVECIQACDVLRHAAPTTSVSFGPGCCGVAPIYVYDAGGPSGNYPDNQNHTITYTAPAGQVIRVEFLQVAIDWTDYLIISEPTSAGERVIAVISNVTSPADLAALGPIRSTGNIIRMRFVSDGSWNAAGWLAALHCESAGGPAQPSCFLTMPLGSSGSTNIDLQSYGCCGGLLFTDHGGLISYAANSQNHAVTFSAPAGQRVALDFRYFELVDTDDSLIVYDGPSTSSPRIGGYTGARRPPSITSAGNTLTVQFKSDASVMGRGWEATVRCATATSLSHKARTEVWLYPNPSADKEAWLEAPHQPIRRVRLWDVQGRLVQEIQGESMRWQLHAPMGGVYVVEGELQSGDWFATRWVVLE